MSAYLNALHEEATRDDLLHEVTRLHEENSRLRAALAFYADATSYRQTGWQGDPDPAPVMSDRGTRAREAISSPTSA
jgi:hypothetical protein